MKEKLDRLVGRRLLTYEFDGSSLDLVLHFDEFGDAEKKGASVRITAEGGMGYNEGLAWLVFDF